MPWFEVIAVPLPGRLHHLGQRLDRLDGATLRVDSGRWVLHAAGEPLRWNGQRVLATPPLEHSDVIHVSRSVCVRYLEHDAPTPRAPALERAIAECPSDAQRWAVWADWLAEQGDARAELVHQTRDESGDARARRLGALAAAWLDGRVELSWRRGFIHTAKLRLRGTLHPLARLERLFQLEAAAFVEHVYCDPPRLQELHELLAAMRTAPTSLSSIAVGPVAPETLVTPQAEAELARLREGRPRLISTAGTLLQRFTRCVLTCGRDERALRPGVTWVNGLPIELQPDGATLLADPTHATVNGAPGHQVRLLHGDVIEVNGRPTWTVAYQ